MSNAAILGQELGKRYKRGLVERSGLLRDKLGSFVKSPIATLRQKKAETFWALKDVSLEVKEGEVLGLIGRNGGGKTTLLKILSRITRPTAGWADIDGRVGSLLEVGTGFHPELTGRENTFLSGAILGMRKKEIGRKFDEIVAFAELEKFIDTAVKHYSSGMYVRLAFAVAAHLEPEILLVDEVLAVGDIRFQKKCIGKMGDVAKTGRTVVLVSHQLNQIRRLCQRVIWMDEGTIRSDGDATEVTGAYELAMSSDERPASTQRNARARFSTWKIAGAPQGSSHVLASTGEVTCQFGLEVIREILHGHHRIALYNAERQLIWAWSADDVHLSAGQHELSYTFPSLPVKPGPYNWVLSLSEGYEAVESWEFVPAMMVATETFQHARDEWNGVLNVPCEFSIQTKSDGYQPDDN